MDSITTLEHIRQHVLDDAADLISAIGVADPLVSSENLKKLGQDREPVARFLRKLLTRNIVLIICRLHEKSGTGPTGETASIEALLEYARGQVSDSKIAAFQNRRKTLIVNLEAKGIKYRDLYEFRTAEMAHSIHRFSQETDNTLFYSSILEFSHDTYELILEIDNELVLTGSTRFVDFPHLFHIWLDRGRRFWAELESED